MISVRGSAQSKNVCVFGADELAVSVSAVIACKCPKINVSVVDFNSDQVVRWEERKVKDHEPDLEELLEKCHNENLFFMTDIAGAILMADIILLMIDSPDSQNMQVPEIKEFEEAARLVAELSESSKIIVQKYLNVPLRTCEVLKIILDANKSTKARFQVLVMPEFFTAASPVSYLLNPEFVFIGHEESPEGKKAATTLMDIYAEWIPKERIKTMNCTSAELSKLSISALLAQKAVSVGALAAICEQSGKNFHEIVRVLTKSRRVAGDRCPEFEIGLGDANLHRDVLKLIRFYRKLKMSEVKDYWQELIDQNDYQDKRFRKKILSTFFNALNKKKLAVFGVSCKGNGRITIQLPAMRLSAWILKEGGSVFLYGTNVETNREGILQAVKDCGAEHAESRLTLFEDPYKAAEKVHGIILCTDHNKELKSLDFAAILRDMMKPAYIFDGRNILDHEVLMKIGFKVKTIGREY